MIRDRKYHLQTNESCLVGSEMVDFLIHLSPIVHSRSLAVGMWQALLEIFNFILNNHGIL